VSLIGLLYALRYGFEQVNRPHILEPLHDNTHYFQRQNQARGSWFAGTWQATLQPISISWPSFFFTDFRCDRRLLLAVFLTRTLSGSSSGFFLALDLVSSSMLHLYTVFYDLNSTFSVPCAGFTRLRASKLLLEYHGTNELLAYAARPSSSVTTKTED